MEICRGPLQYVPCFEGNQKGTLLSGQSLCHHPSLPGNIPIPSSSCSGSQLSDMGMRYLNDADVVQLFVWEWAVLF